MNKLEQQKKKKTLSVCHHKWDQCDCVTTVLPGSSVEESLPDYSMSVHSLYYLTKQEITKAVMCTKKKTHLAVLHLFPKSAGLICNDELYYDTTLDGNIYMQDKHTGNTDYTHKNMDWLLMEQSFPGVYDNKPVHISWVKIRAVGDTHVFRFFEVEGPLDAIRKPMFTKISIDNLVNVNSGIFIKPAFGHTRYINLDARICNKLASTMVGKKRNWDTISTLTTRTLSELNKKDISNPVDLLLYREYMAWRYLDVETSTLNQSAYNGTPWNDLEAKRKVHEMALDYQVTPRLGIMNILYDHFRYSMVVLLAVLIAAPLFSFTWPFLVAFIIWWTYKNWTEVGPKFTAYVQGWFDNDRQNSQIDKVTPMERTLEVVVEGNKLASKLMPELPEIRSLTEILSTRPKTTTRPMLDMEGFEMDDDIDEEIREVREEVDTALKVSKQYVTESPEVETIESTIVDLGVSPIVPIPTGLSFTQISEESDRKANLEEVISVYQDEFRGSNVHLDLVPDEAVKFPQLECDDERFPDPTNLETGP
jgi:hypothetical protein